MEDIVAPAALSDGDTLYLFQWTFEQRPIFSLLISSGSRGVAGRIYPWGDDPLD